MEVKFGPNSLDEPNLLYKLQRKIKIFNTSDSLPNRGYNLVVTSSKYGLAFIASPDGTLAVYYLRDLIDKESEPLHISVKLPEKATHVAVSCDQELLAVTGGQILCVYGINDFQNQNVSPRVSIKFEVSPSTFVSALQWNPCIPETLAIAFFDGTLLVGQTSIAQIKKVQSKARCICWSPKGKQLVTGNSDGTLSQYKPDLTPAKMIPAPNLFEGAPAEALAIYWISTYQFTVVYKNATDNSRPVVAIVNIPKAGQPSCLNYEDICYSMGANRPWFYYLQGIAQWNMILASSSNSMEIATLGSADGANWVQWCQTDEARPELPLTDKKQENYPVGVCIDTCAIHQLPWGENETLPFMPLLLVVSQSGLLTVFNIINLNKAAPQLCTPPQQFTLPKAAMVSTVSCNEQTQPSEPVQPAPVVVQPKPQQIQQPTPIAPVAQPAFGAPPNQFSIAPNNAFNKPLILQQPQQTQEFGGAPTPQMTEQKPDVKSIAVTSQRATIQPKPTALPAKPAQAQEITAALKAEQEKINKMKADQELRNMLVKEVNDFQMELYKFLMKTRNVQARLQQDLDSMDSTFNFQSLDTEQLRKDCSLEELRAAVVQHKLELVRACAAVAEARTHTEAKEVHQWTQADPLTAKRVASVKKLAYYVQTQLEQAQKALDYKWNEINRDRQYNRPGQRMIRPILDDVYQPLVKQQEILARQQAVLRTLRNTLKECDATPMFKSTSLLRSTPFRNKDPLSKLTKNILNMSIEPQPSKEKDQLLSAQKLDALRDMLSNHRPVKIKPVNVELRQHLAALRLSYEKSVKEKAVQPPQVTVKTEVIEQPEIRPAPVTIKSEPKPDLIIKQPQNVPNVPSFTPVNNLKPTVPGLSNVARTLFTEPKQEPIKSPLIQTQPQMQLSQPSTQPLKVPKPQYLPQLQQETQPQAPLKREPFGFSPPTSITVTANTRSVLKDMLQNKQANAEANSDGNTFMGQKICSPTPFAFAPASGSTSQPPPISFTSKPINDMNNMFSKFTPQTFAPDPKTQSVITKPKSNETGEPETPESDKQIGVKVKEAKPLTNLFALRTSTPLAANAQNVPDVLKSNAQGFTAVKLDSKSGKLIEKTHDVSKENVPEKSNENISQKIQKPVNDDKIENELKTSTVSNKSSIFASTAQPVVTVTAQVSQPSSVASPSESQKSAQSKVENKVETPKSTEKSEASANSSASSIFAAANAAAPTASKSTFGTSTPTSSPTSVFSTPTSTPPLSISPNTPTSKEITASTTTTPSASFLFGTAMASQSSGKTTTSGSLFATTATNASNVMGASTQSIFGTATTDTQSTASSIFGMTTTQSVFSSSPSAKPTVFSAPTPSTPSTTFGSTSASVFATATSQPSVFGSSTTSVFGNTVTSVPDVFGTNTTTQSVFGSPTSTTTQSIFGAAAATTQSSLFGNTTTTTQSVFGSTTATTQASVFGSSPANQSSVFGSSTSTTQPSVFGTPTQATQASIFGSPTKTTPASVFGTPTQTTQASVFGTPPSTTAQSGSLFGGTESNLFAAASISTTNAPSPTSGGNVFGGSSSGSVFGGSASNVFGSKTTFGQANPTVSSIFGGGASFGQSQGSNFWGTGNTSGGNGFGSSAFGQQATTQSSSIFGGAATGGSFSSPSGGQAFGSPPQSSVFGTSQQQSAPGFGGSPVFGNKPVFGQSTGFGSPPAGGGFGSSFGGFSKSPSSGFGSSATFGGGATFGGTAFGNTSPGKSFGGGGASPGFGTTQSNATFESLATQNTLTFGNLAQQSGQPTQQAPTFNTSPSFTGWRG